MSETYSGQCDMCSKHAPVQDVNMSYESGATLCAACAELIAWDIRNDEKNGDVKETNDES